MSTAGPQRGYALYEWINRHAWAVAAVLVVVAVVLAGLFPVIADETEPSAASQRWHGADLNTASPQEMEAVLADTVLGEFKTRLARIGLEYQTPAAP